MGFQNHGRMEYQTKWLIDFIQTIMTSQHDTNTTSIEIGPGRHVRSYNRLEGEEMYQYKIQKVFQ